MTDRADAIESMEQLAVVWRVMVLDRDSGADVRDLPGIAVRWADRRFTFWNCITPTEVGADVRLVEQRLSQGRLFVALVATDPERERRGYGEAVARKALYEGGRATGLTRATLHAIERLAPRLDSE